MKIVIELTAQEVQWMLEFIDAGLKVGGLKALTQASVLHQKTMAAVNAAEAAVENRLPSQP